jgi:hypothetical protein
MKPLLLLQETIDTLWFWTYGIIVGWGASFTIVMAILVVLVIKILRMHRRMNSVENRIVVAEREINLALSKLEHDSKN